MQRPDPRGRALLRAYRSAKVSPPADRDALWVRIEASLDAGARGPRLLEPSSEPPPGLEGARGRSWVAPVVGVAVVIAAVVVAALALRPSELRDPVVQRAPSQATHEAAPREPLPVVAESSSEGAPGRATPSALPMPVPSLEPAAAGPRRMAPAVDREPPVAARTSGSSATEEPPEEATDALVAELALVREARHALRDERPARALELLDAHARAFPTGQMREDRQALRIEALCAAGKAPQARAEAGLFLRAFPDSAHVQRVRSSCAEP